MGTPGPNAGHQIKHTLLEDGCSRDPTVEILESGTGQTAKWKSQMFEFVKHDSVWLHCDVQACHSKEENCQKDCSDDFSGPMFTLNNRRKKRAPSESAWLRPGKDAKPTKPSRETL